MHIILNNAYPHIFLQTLSSELTKIDNILQKQKKKSCFLYHSQFFNLWHITFISSCFNTRFGLIKFMSNEHMKRKENQKACSCPLVSQWLHSERLLKPGLLPEQACNDAQRHPWCFEGKDLADLNLLRGISPNPHGLDVKSIISLLSSTIYLSSEKRVWNYNICT